MRSAVAATAVAVALLAPAGAEAATLDNRSGVLTYTAATASRVSFLHPGASPSTVLVTLHPGHADGLTVSGCTETASGRFECSGVGRVDVTGSDQDDIFVAPLLRVPITLAGGPGTDVLEGGYGIDFILGGPGDDVLNSGPGDTLSGGEGIDTVVVGIFGTEPITYSLDDLANDGLAGDGTNLRADLEQIQGPDPFEVQSPQAPLTLIGNAAANRLRAGSANDTLIGGGGPDILDASWGDDTIQARDGAIDRVVCGPGTDVAVVDPLDQVSDTCETVQVAEAGVELEDRPPTVAWPRGARLAPGVVATLPVTAGDDRGVASVRVLRDGRQLCMDTTAPFTCDYRPQPGRHTLVAIATDVSGQTASAVRAVEVARYVPRSVSLRVSKRFVATGKVTLPAGARCAGTVEVRVGGLARRDRLDRSCRYRVRFERAGRFRATFLGTETIAQKRSEVRARTG